MADNRMWLKCKKCGRRLLLAKRSGIWRDWNSCKLDEWLFDHSFCGDDSKVEGYFILEFES
jgi:hypothetical protein